MGPRFSGCGHQPPHRRSGFGGVAGAISRITSLPTTPEALSRFSSRKGFLVRPSPERDTASTKAVDLLAGIFPSR